MSTTLGCTRAEASRSGYSPATRQRLCTLLWLAQLVSACGSSVAPTPTIPNYGGTWSGSYVITSCNQTGGIAVFDFCNATASPAPFTLSFTQNGRSVAGRFSLAAVQFEGVSSTVAPDGSLTITGNNLTNGLSIVATWTLNRSAPSMPLSGTLAQIWTAVTLVSGQVNILATITNTSQAGMNGEEQSPTHARHVSRGRSSTPYGLTRNRGPCKSGKLLVFKT
jgi:hypothetical protein